MKLDKNTLRVVCTKCPAVARVDYVERDYRDDAYLVSLWCHETRIVALMDHDVVANEISEGRDLVLAQFRQLHIDHINERLEEAEALAVKAMERAAMLQQFIREGMPS